MEKPKRGVLQTLRQKAIRAAPLPCGSRGSVVYYPRMDLSKSQLRGAAMILGAGAAIGLGGKLWIDWASAKSANTQAATVALGLEAHNLGVQSQRLLRRAQRSPAEVRRDMATAAWAEFDGLPDSVRSKEMLGAFLLKANQVVAGVPEGEALRVREFNQAQFRKRFAAFLIVGEPCIAYGEQFEKLEPSTDPARCVELVRTWKTNGWANELRELGYRELVCLDDSHPLSGTYPL